jgi:hypothetical protein
MAWIYFLYRINLSHIKGDSAVPDGLFSDVVLSKLDTLSPSKRPTDFKQIVKLLTS